MPWFKRNTEIDDALAANDLSRARQLLERLKPSRATRLWRRELAKKLLSRVSGHVAAQYFRQAWEDLSAASEYAEGAMVDKVANESNQLIELTIESADALLQSGKTKHALDTLQLLAERKIADWRADRLQEVGDCLLDAEDLAALGKLDKSIQRLKAAVQVYPELSRIHERIKLKEQRQTKLAQLLQQLESAAMGCRWKEVQDTCGQVLKIAPQHEIAIGAQRHAARQMKRRTSVGSRLTNVPPRSPENLLQSNRQIRMPRLAPTPSTAVVDAGSKADDDPLESEGLTRLGADTDAFLVWVDGVGGYLICTQLVNFIGQATDQTAVSIPLQADIRKRHARLETVDGRHLVQPLGPLRIDDRKVSADQSQVLRDGQTLTLGTGVQLSYAQSHPLCKSARLDFASRHRTQPWSDGIVLAGQSVVLGPNSCNQIYCPRWKHDLILFRRNGQWFARCNEEFCIDDQPQALQGQINLQSRLVGSDFSLKLEAVT